MLRFNCFWHFYSILLYLCTVKRYNSKYNSIRKLSVALLMLFLAYYGGVTLFPHAHVVEGVVIYHSHPYSSSSNHTHSNIEYQTVRALSMFIFLVFAVSAVLGLACKCNILSIARILNPISRRCYIIYSLRAPPLGY